METVTMRCANCGGTIHVNEPCEDCGIRYDEMLENIQHTEMKRLFKKIESLQKEHESIAIEASLMACELENSSLILPAKIEEDSLGIIHLPVKGEGHYLVLCTDMDEFKSLECLTPLTNSWEMLLQLLEDGDGVAININSDSCFLENKFLKQFFSDKLNIS